MTTFVELPIILALSGLLSLPGGPPGMDLRPYAAGEYRDYSAIVYCYWEEAARKMAAATARNAAGEITDEELRTELMWINFWHACENERQYYTYLKTLERGKVPGTRKAGGKTFAVTRDASIFLARLRGGQVVYAVTHAPVPPPSGQSRTPAAGGS